MKFHWGSVAGGSLLLGVFYFVDFILDFFFSNDRDIKKKTIRKQNFQKDVIEYPEGEGYGNRVTSFFNLVRSESMGYINIIPIGYCNASRYSEYMAEESHFYDRSQTVNRVNIL